MKKHSVCSGIQNHNHNINSSLKDCFLIKRILTFFQINQIMNFSINLLEANTLDVGHIKSLKKEVFQSIDEHQTLLEALFNKNCLLLLTSQQSDSPKYSYEVNKQFSQLLNRYQGCLGYNINLGKLAISILQAFQETLSNQEDSQKLMLQNFQKSQAKLYEETQYLFRQKKIIQEENIRLSLEVQGLNNLLGEQDEKIKQLSQHLQMQKKLAVQLAKSVQAKIGYIEQEHKKFIEKRIQHQISQLKQGIHRLTYLYQQKKKEFQNIKMEKEQLQLELITLKSVKQPQNQLYVRERKEIYPLSEITPIICNETIQSSSSLSRQLRNSYNLQKQDHYQIANLKKEMRVLCSPQLLKDCDDDKQNIESLNKTFNNNLYTHKSKNKNRNNTKKIEYAYKNIGVNTQNILMHTKITQISGISKISQFKYPGKTQVHIQTLKQTQFRLPETLIKNDLKKEQGNEQQKNIVKSLIRYMSDKVIYGRIKRKN